MNREELTENEMVKGNLGDNDWEMIKFKILRKERKEGGFNRFRDLVDRIPGEAGLRTKGVQESWVYH